MNLTHESSGPATVVKVDGDLDVYSAPEFRSLLIDLIADSPPFVAVDLTGCTFLDATGLGVLIGTLKRARAKNGQVDLICTADSILKIFRNTGLTKVFAIYGSPAEAVAALSELAGVTDVSR